MNLSLKVIQDQSESNSKNKKKQVYLGKEAGLTPLLAMTQSFEDCDWLVVQRFSSRVYYKPSL